MVIYLDASALIKLYFPEEHHGWTRRTVNGHRRAGGVIATSVAGYVEANAAFARARKRRPTGQRIPEDLYRRASAALLDDARERIVLRRTDDALIDRAVRVGHEHALRGYDAMHLAAALNLRDELASATRATRSGRAEARERPPELPEFTSDAEREEPAEVLLLTYDSELHDVAVAEGIAHERPGRAGGERFGA